MHTRSSSLIPTISEHKVQLLFRSHTYGPHSSPPPPPPALPYRTLKSTGRLHLYARNLQKAHIFSFVPRAILFTSLWAWWGSIPINTLFFPMNFKLLLLHANYLGLMLACSLKYSHSFFSLSFFFSLFQAFSLSIQLSNTLLLTLTHSLTHSHTPMHIFTYIYIYIYRWVRKLSRIYKNMHV